MRLLSGPEQGYDWETLKTDFREQGACRLASIVLPVVLRSHLANKNCNFLLLHRSACSQLLLSGV